MGTYLPVGRYNELRMAHILSRRRLLGLGGAAVSSGALAAAGFQWAGVPGRDGPGRTRDVLLIDEADPTATPVMISVPTSVPTDTPTPTATAMPAATGTIVGHHHPSARPAWSSDLLRQVIRSGPTDRPQVALTIDDGWSSRDAILDVLQKKKVFPTLFLAGRPILGDKAFVARAFDSGCEIANHTWDHYDLINKTADYIQKDLHDFEDLVRDQVTGATTLPYMRPSGGSVNQGVIDASAAAGYRVILWSGSAGDGSASTTPGDMVKNVLASARPGAIILMPFTDRGVIALPGIIDGIRAKGLEPVSLSKLFEPNPPAPI